MTALFLPRRFSSQPQQLAGIAPDAVSRLGLLRAYYPAGSTIFDPVGNSKFSLLNSRVEAGSRGLGARHNALTSSTTTIKATENDWLQSVSTQLTFFLLLEPISRSASDFAFGHFAANGAAGNYNFGLYWSGTGAQAFVRNASNTAVSTAAVPFTAGVPQLWLATYDGANVRFYLDGVLRATQAQTGFPNRVFLDVAFGGWNAGACITTKSYLAGIANRAWSDSQVRDFSANPWQIFKAPSRQLFAANDAGAAGVTGSISAVEPSDALAATAIVSVTGSASWTEDGDQASVTGSVRVTATASWTEDADAAALSGSVVAGTSATIAWTEDSDTAALSGSVRVAGSASWTEAPDTTAISAAVAVPVTGAISWTEEDFATLTGISAAAPATDSGGSLAPTKNSRRKRALEAAEALQRMLEPQDEPAKAVKRIAKQVVAAVTEDDATELAELSRQIAMREFELRQEQYQAERSAQEARQAAETLRQLEEVSAYLTAWQEEQTLLLLLLAA